jgi:type I restriction enzyme, S subunit
MSKNNENKLMPTLRFPEFKKDGIWKETIFNQLFEFGNGKDYKHLSSGNIPVYGTGGKMLSVNDYLYEGESVCIGRKGTIDNPMFLTGKFWTVDTLFYTHSFQNCIPKFIYYVFLTINWYDYNEAGGVPSLSKTTISKIKTLVPPEIQEQQKIAACLSSLDEVITAESQKLDILKDHKKGLLQNLLPQEGETMPRLRFKEFEDSGEWKEDTLGDYLLRNPEYGINAPAVPFSNILPTYIRITDISVDGRFLSNEKVSVDREVTENNYLAEGDIVLARTGASVGKPYKYRNEDGRLVFAGFLIRVKPDANKLISDFLFLFLFTRQYSKWVSFISARSGQPGINGTEYASMPICLPPSLSEQQKIASCLSSIDELINAQSQKVETLKLHKKGLLQGLFPTLNNEE